MNFYLGCAVWSYKGWIGTFYPPKSKAKDFLRLYSQRLSTVEGNTTFYAVPEAKTVEKWTEETPANFKFCLKFPREISHNGLLMPSLEKAIAFLERINLLGDRLGSVFLQLPPSYSFETQEDLTNFLKTLSQETKNLAVEVRNLNWFQEPHVSQLNALLKNLNVGKVLLDTRPIYNCPDDPQIAFERRKPEVPLQPYITSKFAIARFISHPKREYNQSYLQEWVNQCDRWLRQGIDVYFFVHCPIEDHSPFTARYFQHLLEQKGAMVPRLPWDKLESDPIQLSLF
jgi:uncharacterized protein YecE (DUF72 family)